MNPIHSWDLKYRLNKAVKSIHPIVKMTLRKYFRVLKKFLKNLQCLKLGNILSTLRFWNFSRTTGNPNFILNQKQMIICFKLFCMIFARISLLTKLQMKFNLLKIQSIQRLSNYKKNCTRSALIQSFLTKTCQPLYKNS